MTPPADLAALRKLVEAVTALRQNLLAAFQDGVSVWSWYDEDTKTVDAALPAAREALERVEKIIGLQRAALDVWKKAHPHEQNPGACSLEEVTRWKNACYAARGILRGLEGSPEAALAAVEKLEWAIGGAPDPEDETYQKVVTFLHERGRSGWANWAEELLSIAASSEVERNALQNTLRQWNTECGEGGPRPIKARIVRLEEALSESVKLQSHYAAALNVWDGGQRIVFKDSTEWLARLAMSPAERRADVERRTALEGRDD